MEKLNALERSAKFSADNFEPETVVKTKDILAIAEAFTALEQRAEAAEAKLAEMEKQAPTYYVMSDDGDFEVNTDNEFSQGRRGFPVFTRPAPAVSLAELVPGEISAEEADAILTEKYGQFMEQHFFCADSFEEGANWRRSQILRNIEEAK